MKKSYRETEHINKLKKEKSTRIVNAFAFILISSLLFFSWLREVKEYKFDDLIKITGNLASYDYRKPGDRGLGYEGKKLFVRLDKYKTEFRLNIDYVLFVDEIEKSKTTELTTYIEPKYQKYLFDTNGDVKTIGLVINDLVFDIPDESLNKRNWAMNYGVPIISIVLLLFGLNEIIKVRRLKNKIETNTSP